MTQINKYKAWERILDMVNILCESDRRITVKGLAEKYGFSTDFIINDLCYIHNTEETGLMIATANYADYDEDSDSEKDIKQLLKRWNESDTPITALRRMSTNTGDIVSLQISEVEKLFLDSFLNENKYVDQSGDILIKNAPEYASKERVEILQQLDKAIKIKTNLVVDYEEHGKSTKLEIAPLSIVRMVADNLYYCMAEYEGEIRYFRADKLYDPEDKPRKHDVPQEDIDKEIELLNLRWGMLGKSKPFDFEMIVYNEANLSNRLKYELKNRKNAVWEELPDGKWLYKDKVIDFESLKTWVLGLGKSVKVVKPQKMADEILADAKKRYEYYRRFFEVAETGESQP